MTQQLYFGRSCHVVHKPSIQEMAGISRSALIRDGRFLRGLTLPRMILSGPSTLAQYSSPIRGGALLVAVRGISSTSIRQTLQQQQSTSKPSTSSKAAAATELYESTASKPSTDAGSKAAKSEAGKAAQADAAAAGTKDETSLTAKEKKPSLWQRVKHEANHYWNGTKLLGYEIRVSTKLALKLASGRELTRREDRQLRRTVNDIVRLVPFSVFVLVPFAELLLPIALKIFPNLLPSTYESDAEKKAKTKKLSAARVDLSQYLQTGVRSNKVSMPTFKDSKQREQFALLFRLLRQGEKPDRDLTLNVARIFKDDQLLDNFSRPQLAGLAKYMNLQPYGTTTILRYSIRHRLRIIKQDDRIIDYEGVDSLNTLELQNACQSRGFPTYGVSSGRLREDLANWLQLRLHDRVPSTLLILGSAFTYGARDLDSLYDGILDVLAALPPEVYHEAELEVADKDATNEQRLEVLKEQQELIQDEEKEEQDSGHVIGVKDTLNVDDDSGPPSSPGKPEPTESEEDAKADQEYYTLADERKPEPTVSEEDVKADETFSNVAGKSNSGPTESEEDAKADQEYYTLAKERKPEPTVSEEDAKADETFYNDAGKSNSGPTESEEITKSDQAFYEHAEQRKPKPTESEEISKADAELYQEKEPLNSHSPKPDNATKADSNSNQKK